MQQKDTGVLIKVDKNTKEKMKKLKINWSKEIREFISERINKEGNLARAVALSDRLLNSQKKKKTNTAEVIRKFRDERYGPSSG